MTGAEFAPGTVSAYARRSALTAHLLGIGNVVFSLVGLVGALVILKTNRNEAFVRANARNALNMQITWLLFAAIVFAIYLAVALGHGPIVRAQTVETGQLLPMKSYWEALSLVGLIVLSMIVTIVLNIAGAFAANAGRVYRYPLAIPFVRPKN